MSDDPRLNLLIKEGVDGEVVVVGYPYEEAARRCARKAGQENGPCCVRRFWGKVGPLVNAEYGLDISKLRVTDMGNIEADGLTVEEGVKKLSSRLDKYLSNKQFPIVIGGSK
jgi:formiminoglutamase